MLLKETLIIRSFASFSHAINNPTVSAELEIRKHNRNLLYHLNDVLAQQKVTSSKFDDGIKLITRSQIRLIDISFPMLLKFLKLAVHFRRRDQIDRVLQAINHSHELEAFQLLDILRIHSKSKDMIGLISTFQLFREPRFDIPIIHDCILSCWAVNSSTEGGIKQLESILNIKMKPSEQVMLDVVDQLVAHENFEEAHVLVERLGSIRASIHFLTSWINLKGRQNHQNVTKLAERVLELSKRLPKDELESVFITMFDLARRKTSQALAMKIMKNIEQAELKPSPALLAAEAAALLVCGKAKLAHNIIFSLLEQEPNQEWPNISGSTSRMIGSCLKMNDLHTANMLVDALRARKLRPTAHIAHQFLVYYIRKSNKSAGLDMYDEMIKDGLVPNSRLFEVVLELCQGNDEKMAYYWSQLEMIGKNQPKNTSTKEQQLSLPFYTPVHAQKMVQHLLRSEMEMDESKLNLNVEYAPSRRSYLALAQMMKTMGNIKNVETVLAKMESKGYPLCVRAYNILLSAYRSKQDLFKIEELVLKLAESNYQLAISHYRIIIAAYVEAKDFQRAWDWLKTMKDYGYGVSSIERNLHYEMRRSGVREFSAKSFIYNAKKIPLQYQTTKDLFVEQLFDELEHSIKP